MHKRWCPSWSLRRKLVWTRRRQTIKRNQMIVGKDTRVASSQKGSKRGTEESTIIETRPSEITINLEEGEEKTSSPIWAEPPKHLSSSIWKDVTLNMGKYISARLPFHEEFPINFQIIVHIRLKSYLTWWKTICWGDS